MRLYSVVEELLPFGFSSERYDRVSDFTRNVGIVPVSAKSGVGVAELVALVVGLSQRFLEKDLALGSLVGEGTILERTEQRDSKPWPASSCTRGRSASATRYRDYRTSGPFPSRVRGLYRPAPSVSTGERRPRRSRASNASPPLRASSSAPGRGKGAARGVDQGGPHPRRAGDDARRAGAASPSRDGPRREWGVALAADTLGGLEALVFECRAASVPVHVAEIGPANRPMVLRMADLKDETHRAILAFNVPILPDAVPVSTGPGHLLGGSDVPAARAVCEVARGEVARPRRGAAARYRTPVKLQVLPGFVFRRSRPAVVGVKVLSGQLRPGVRLMSIRGEEVGMLRSLQRENESVKEAEEGAELAASIERGDGRTDPDGGGHPLRHDPRVVGPGPQGPAALRPRTNGAGRSDPDSPRHPPVLGSVIRRRVRRELLHVVRGPRDQGRIRPVGIVSKEYSEENGHSPDV